MAQINIYIELPEDHDGETAPAFMHDLLKYQIDPLVIDEKIVNYEWEIV
jgi:hypothetical protein